MPASNKMSLMRRVSNHWVQSRNPGENHWTIGCYISQSCEFDRIFFTKLARTTYETTIEVRQNNLYKVVSRPLNFKRMANFPATSFLEDQRLGIQAREQGFPKRYPTLSDSPYRVISWACNEASNLGGRIYATVTQILLKIK